MTGLGLSEEAPVSDALVVAAEKVAAASECAVVAGMVAAEAAVSVAVEVAIVGGVEAAAAAPCVEWRRSNGRVPVSTKALEPWIGARSP